MSSPYLARMQPRPEHWSNAPTAEDRRVLAKNTFLPVASSAKLDDVSEQEELKVESRGDASPVIEKSTETRIENISLLAKEKVNRQGLFVVDLTDISESNFGPNDQEKKNPEGCMENVADCFASFKEDVAFGLDEFRKVFPKKQIASSDETLDTHPEAKEEPVEESEEEDPHEALEKSFQETNCVVDALTQGVNNIRSVDFIPQAVIEEDAASDSDDDSEAEEEKEEEVDESYQFALPPSVPREDEVSIPTAETEEEEEEEEEEEDLAVRVSKIEEDLKALEHSMTDEEDSIEESKETETSVDSDDSSEDS